jgi:hypothetical protein
MSTLGIVTNSTLFFYRINKLQILLKVFRKLSAARAVSAEGA